LGALEMRSLLILGMFLVLISSVSAIIIDGYEFPDYECNDGFCYVDDTNIYINATENSKGNIDLWVMSKSYTGDVNLGFLFNRSDITPTFIGRYNPTNYNDYFYNQLGENLGLYQYTRTFNSLNKLVDTRTFNFDGKDTLKYITNVPVVANNLEHLSIRFETKNNTPKTKYDIIIYPSFYGSDLNNALSNGHIYLLDPYIEGSNTIDSFNRSDRSISSDTAENGNTWTSGAYSNIVSNELVTTNYDQIELQIDEINSSFSSDSQISWKMKFSTATGTQEHRFMLGSSTASADRALYIQMSGGTWKVSDNASSTVDSGKTFSANTYYTITLKDFNFSSTPYTYDWYVDDVLYGDDLQFFRSKNLSYVQYFLSTSGVTGYFDELIVDIFSDTNNTAPVIENVSIVPNVAYYNSVLNCSGDFFDSDSDSESISTYKWFKDGSLISGETSVNLSDQFVSGDNIVCEYTPYDGMDYGSAVNSTQKIISDTLSTSQNVSISPNPAYANSTLLGNYDFLDYDGDSEIGSTYKWFKNGLVISGQTTTTLTNSSFVIGDNLTFEVSTGTLAGVGAPINSSTIQIQQYPNNPPTGSHQGWQPGNIFDGSDVQCYYLYNDEDGDSDQSFFKWFVNNVNTYNGTTLPHSYFVKGDDLSCDLVLFDGIDEVYIDYSINKTVLNTLPVVENVSIQYGDPIVDFSLNGTYDIVSDVDGDTISFTYRWFNDSGLITGQTAFNLSNAFFSSGDNITFEVRPYDGEGYGTRVNSTSILISGNQPPSGSNFGFVDTYIYSYENNLVCNYTYSDVDGDSDQSYWKYYVNDVFVSFNDIDSVNMSVDDTLKCELFLFDGVNTVNKGNQSSVVQNSLPTIVGSPVFEPEWVNESIDVNVTYVFVDLDDEHSDNSTYKWFKNGFVIENETSLFLNSSLYNNSDILIFEIYVCSDDGVCNYRRNSSELVVGYISTGGGVSTPLLFGGSVCDVVLSTQTFSFAEFYDLVLLDPIEGLLYSQSYAYSIMDTLRGKVDQGCLIPIEFDEESQKVLEAAKFNFNKDPNFTNAVVLARAQLNYYLNSFKLQVAQ
jgi:hypothetical protein